MSSNSSLPPPATPLTTSRFILSMALMGLCALLLLGSAVTFLKRSANSDSQYDWHMEEFISEGQNAFNLSNLHSTPSWQYSLILAGGAAGFCLGLALLLRRFTLRFLLAAVLCAGLLGAWPLLSRPDPSGRRVRIVLAFQQPLKIEQETALQARLQPDTALATWPDEMRAELDIPVRAVRNVTVKPALKHELNPPDSMTWISQGTACEFELAYELTGEQCRTLVEFYRWYFLRLGLENAMENGQSKSSSRNTFLGGDWERWEQAWLDRNGEP